MVGSAIIGKLISAGYKNIVSNYFRKKPVTNYGSRVTFVGLDLRNQAATDKFFKKEKPDYVFLAAAKVGGILANNTYRAEFIYDNIMIAANVIHASYACGVKKLLNLGSSCIYPKMAPQPVKEEYLLTGALEPTNEPYAIAKISAIKLCRYYNEQYGTNFISVMPTNLYGPNDNFDLETSHVLPALVRKFHLGKLLRDAKVKVKAKANAAYKEIIRDLKRFPPGFSLNLNLDLNLERLGITSEYVRLWGTGRPYREFLYVDDLAEACIFLMDRYDAMPAAMPEFVNIGTGRDITIGDLAEMVKGVVGFKGGIEWDSTKPDGTPRKLLDISRIKSLGWDPTVPLEEGIRRTYQWYLSRKP